jgi:hypothetical protein
MPGEETRLRDLEVVSHQEYIKQQTGGGGSIENDANDFNFSNSRNGEQGPPSDEMGFEDNV